MSCEFQLFASVEGINKLIDAGKESDNSKNILQDFQIAVSQSREIIVFARGTWLLVCESKWNSSAASEATIKYTPKWHGHINCKPGEEITSILCLPFFSQDHRAHWCADWTCIILGFSSGCIKYYTEGMQELAWNFLHEGKIINMKCFYSASKQEVKSQKYDNSDIYMVYKTVFCIVNKSQLYQALRNKRNQLAKGILMTDTDSESYLSLDFKKYSYAAQEEVNDACFIGQAQLSTLNTFDHLVRVSLADGFHSNFRVSPPQTSLIMTTGKKPFVGFHYTLEGISSPVLTDVALAVASRVKNSVTSTLPYWFGFGNKKVSHLEKPKEVSQDYAERLNCRFGLCDLWRQGKSIVPSPDSAFSAVTDSLGRVTVIDNNSGVAQRMWKGFRDAQCGFLEVKEDIRTLQREKGGLHKPKQRHGLFIVIYTPKKGLIEIFGVHHGRRVGSFKVTKFGRLLYIPGAPSTTTFVGGFTFSQNQVIFFSEEGLSEISVPFHCALVEDNSKISRDLHVLKKMKSLLKMENRDDFTFMDEVKKYASELKTDEIRLQTIKFMLTSKNVTLEAFQVVLKIFLESLQNKEQAEIPAKKIAAFAEATLNLLLFYEFLTNSCEVSIRCEPEKSARLESLPEQLRLSQDELDIMLKIILQIKEIEMIKRQSPKVNFKERKSRKLVQFLACFDFEAFLNCLDKIETQNVKKNLRARHSSVNYSEKEQDLSYLGEVFFRALYSSSSSFDQWKEHMKNSFLNPKDLALCLLSHWCSRSISDDIVSEVMIFVEILKAICLLQGADVVSVEYNSESPWWKQLRSFLAGNASAIRGFFAALCCRSVTICLEQERELSFKHEKKVLSKTKEDTCINESLLLSNDWETISKDSCQWDILIMQLQDLALLNSVLSLTFTTPSELPKIPFDFDHQCLTSIQVGGTGRVSELVAKWLVQFGFEPSALINSTDVEFQINWDKKEVEKEGADLASEIERTNKMRNCCEESKLALNFLAILKTRFPYSLTSSSLVGNTCWEYFAHWFKNVSNINYLKAAVRYLDVIPFSRLKYGLCYLSWTTYVEQKFETLAKIINRMGKVPTDKLCLQETGLRSEQVSLFLKLISEILEMMLQANTDDKADFGSSSREVFWQGSSAPLTSNLVHIALSQPVIGNELLLFPLQLCYSLLMISGLNLTLKQPKLLTYLFDNLEHISFTLARCTQPNASKYYQDQKKTRTSRTEFLKRCLSAAVQTIELVEYIPPISLTENLELVPSTQLNVEEYKKWLHICFELASMWRIPHDDLRRHQVCELYSCGFDRLAEEVVPSVTDTAILASQLLVIGGKRLNYIIQDSNDLSKKLTKLSANLSEWLLTIDLENFTYQGSIDDIGVLMRFVAKWLPEENFEYKLAIEVLDSLLFLKFENS